MLCHTVPLSPMYSRVKCDGTCSSTHRLYPLLDLWNILRDDRRERTTQTHPEYDGARHSDPVVPWIIHLHIRTDMKNMKSIYEYKFQEILSMTITPKRLDLSPEMVRFLTDDRILKPLSSTLWGIPYKIIAGDKHIEIIV